jgi:UDP-N-acetyl-L-fucosamine synthase
MMRLKVITVLGTRPELIRLSAYIRGMDNVSNVDHILVHTGQNDHPQLSDVFYGPLKLRKPNFQFNARRQTRIQTIQQMMDDVRQVLTIEKPQAFVVLGDTDSALTAQVAKQMQIPVFHMEAGNRCFDRRSPEESNRKKIDRLADYNLVYSSFGKKHLLEEKLNQPILMTGSPLREVLTPLIGKIKDKSILSKFQLTPKQYFLWSTHRAEHIDNPKIFNQLVRTLITLAHQYPLYKILVSTHPRFKNKLNSLALPFPVNIEFHEPFGLIEYLSLQFHSKVVLSDSGSIHEEADILGFYAIHLRRRHERQEAEIYPVTYLCEFKPRLIKKYIDSLPHQQAPKNRVEAYQQKNFSNLVIEFILKTLKNSTK